MTTTIAEPTAVRGGVSASLVRENDKYAVALRAAMTRAGEDPDSVVVFDACFDHTWGHLSGYVFAGSEAVVNRAIAHCIAWHNKHAKGSYGAQRSIRQQPAHSFHVSNFDRDNYDRMIAALLRVGVPFTEFNHSARFVAAGASVVYYPCAE